jgi:predicted GNAT family acetyltransferase
MNIQHKESENKASFFIEEEGRILEKMTYSRAGEQLFIIVHTEVGDVLRGKSAGKKNGRSCSEFCYRKGSKNNSTLPVC